MKKVLIVFGTRPEAIKMAPLVLRLEQNAHLKVEVCVTGQHQEMLNQVLDIFEIKPNYDLKVMQKSQDLYDISSRVLLGMRDVLKVAKPDIVLVHGDTTTASMSALAAYYQKIAVGHVEAGLRTNNIYSPYPEEVNRQIIGRIAKYNFAPTQKAKNNLLKENVEEDKIIITGNTVIDALHLISGKIDKSPILRGNLEREIGEMGYDVARINEHRMVLITGHRRENFGDGFVKICESIRHLSLIHKNVDFVYPMHLNPNVRKPVKEILSNLDNVFLIEPLQYLHFVYMMKMSYMVLTDSGGIQEEAPSLGKPVLVMRDTTERPEAVDAGTVRLVGTDRIVEWVEKLLIDKDCYDEMSQTVNPYGDGMACARIEKFLETL